MSDIVFSDFDKSDFVSIRERHEKKNSGLAVKIAVAVCAILLFIEGVVYFVVMPATNLPRIIWSGISSVTEVEAFGLLGKVQEQNWVEFDKEQAISLLMTAPYVEEVTVTKKLPNKVFINVVERKPVAMAFVTEGESTIPVQIDKKGVIFQQSVMTDSSLPLVSGIPVENIPEGMRIPAKYLPLMEQIDSIRNANADYFAAVSEIHVVPKEYGNYELVLYPLHSKTPILTDRALSEDSLRYMMLTIDVVNSLEPNVAEIDLRYGSVSYRMR